MVNIIPTHWAGNTTIWRNYNHICQRRKCFSTKTGQGYTLVWSLWGNLMNWARITPLIAISCGFSHQWHVSKLTEITRLKANLITMNVMKLKTLWTKCLDLTGKFEKWNVFIRKTCISSSKVAQRQISVGFTTSHLQNAFFPFFVF